MIEISAFVEFAFLMSLRRPQESTLVQSLLILWTLSILSYLNASPQSLSSAIYIALVRQSRSVYSLKRASEPLLVTRFLLLASNVANSFLVLFVLIRLNKLLELLTSKFITLCIELMRGNGRFRQRTGGYRSSSGIRFVIGQ